MMKYTKQDPETIKTLFDDIAPNYELGNAVLSFQTYRIWNRALINHIYTPHKPKTLLDLCCGTGDIALPHLRRRKDPAVAYMLDFSREMLSCLKEKAKKMKLDRHEIHALEADAQAIPLSDELIDCATVAYGVRNIKEPALCFQETLRVLKPGGHFGILELTRPNNPFLRFGHRLYLKTALPLIGKMITSNEDAYRYLSGSIHEFVSPDNIAQELALTGFSNVKIKPLFGGIATLILAEKAAPASYPGT